LMMLSRWAQQFSVAEYSVMDELKVGGLTGACLEAALSIERKAIEWGINFPVGGSLLLIAVRPAPVMVGNISPTLSAVGSQ
jgi:hypothetical protein